jgi:hypothetical protein
MFDPPLLLPGSEARVRARRRRRSVLEIGFLLLSVEAVERLAWIGTTEDVFLQINTRQAGYRRSNGRERTIMA